MKSCNEIIKGLREDNDLLQKQVAEYLNISQQLYSRYENAGHELPVRHLIKLAEFYKTSTDFLLGIDHSRDVYGAYEKLNAHQKEKVNTYIMGMLDAK